MSGDPLLPPEVTSLGTRLRYTAEHWGDAEIVFPDERASYRDLDRRVDEMAAVLAGAGVSSGDKVGILLNPSLTFLTALFAIARVGGVIVAINDRLKSDEIRFIVSHADVRVLLTTDAVAEHVDFPTLITGAFPEIADHGGGPIDIEDAPALRRILIFGSAHPGFTPYEHVDPDRGFVEPPTDLDDLAYIMYTSGTSARPKGCMISHRGALRQGPTMAERYQISEGEALWCPLPLFHNGGLAMLTMAMTVGASYVHSGHFEPGTALRQLEEERVTHAQPAFPTITLRILDHPDVATRDLSSLRTMLNVGPPEMLADFEDRLGGVHQINNYGSTEASGHISSGDTREPREIRLRSGGFPLEGMELRVVDPESGADRPAGEVGEILFRGPTRFLGYYKQPDVTAEAIDADGWFHTGDLGVLDADGRITYTGRLKDMLKVGGENVSATEVEAFLVQHPAVNLAVVVGAPDAVYTEVPAAYVETVPGGTITEPELIAYCKGRIATYKIPRYVRVVDEWPMSGTKVKKYVLRQRIADELAELGMTAAPKI
ncbi:MAG TPA: class I adenylate-forming enzyme family protein [Acidimicrobiia bacterium]|nr:class I adenylate-forming enzyme family protein [Acidimicrobiia bacterium]